MAPRRVPPEQRFWANVHRTDICWLWQGGTRSRGYGQMWDGEKTIYAHRFAYELLVGPIPPGLTLDHLCRNPLCVNPDHLEPIPQGTNTLRGFGPPARNARKTHCKRGHPLSGDNVRPVSGGGRRCMACARLHSARRAERRRAGLIPYT